MSYLIRVSLPDVPGSLGQLAEAFGMVDADINSVDIVESSTDGTVTDDLVVTLPTGVMVDTLITAVAAVDGAEVDPSARSPAAWIAAGRLRCSRGLLSAPAH